MTINAEMSTEQKIKQKSFTMRHEGKKNFPYDDGLGNISIGIGRNLTGIGIREDELELMFKNDVDFLWSYFCRTYPWFLELNESRQIAIIDMSFMGIKHFASFEHLIAALAAHNYVLAATEIMHSDYGRKYTTRATDISNIILNGEL